MSYCIWNVGHLVEGLLQCQTQPASLDVGAIDEIIPQPYLVASQPSQVGIQTEWIGR